MKIWSKEEIEFRFYNLIKICNEKKLLAVKRFAEASCDFIENEDERHLYALHYAYYYLKDMFLKINRKKFGEDNFFKLIQEMRISTSINKMIASWDWTWDISTSQYGTYGASIYDAYGTQDILNPYSYTVTTNTI